MTRLVKLMTERENKYVEQLSLYSSCHVMVKPFFKIYGLAKSDVMFY